MESGKPVAKSIGELLADAPYGQRMKVMVDGNVVKGKKVAYRDGVAGVLNLKGNIIDYGSDIVSVDLDAITAVQLCGFWSY